MIIPNKLKKGDTIGVVAPSNPIIGENIQEIMNARKKAQNYGFKVEFSKNLFSNTHGYSSSAKEKAEDINFMFANKNINMIWCAKGGENSNSTFEYLDYNLIKENPKIICGYSDITSLTNIINSKTGLVTFSGTNFKTIATDETDFSYNETIKCFVDGNLDLGIPEDYKVLNEGKIYEGPDFKFEPVTQLDIVKKPSLKIIGTGKRIGKTAVSGLYFFYSCYSLCRPF